MNSNLQFTGVLNDDVEAIASVSNLKDLVDMLLIDEQLRFLILKAIPQLVKNYYRNVKAHDYLLAELVTDLFDMGEFMLIEKIVLEANKVNTKDDVFSGAFFEASKDQALLERYFMMVPANYDWKGFDEVFVMGLEGLEIDKIGDYFSTVLKAAINTNNIYVLNFIIEFWVEFREEWYNYYENATPEGAVIIGKFLEDVDVIIEQAKEIVG